MTVTQSRIRHCLNMLPRKFWCVGVTVNQELLATPGSKSMGDTDGTPPDFLVWGWGSRPTRSHHTEVPSYQVFPGVSRPRHGREERQQLCAIPHGWGRKYSTKDACDPNKSSGPGQSGTVVVRAQGVGMEGRRSGMVEGWRERWVWKEEGSGEWDGVNDQMTT